jgi:8-oxo-dGTP pyrophosphatase MutT (NUDIX family)
MATTDTTRTMITFKNGERKFTYRVAGIAISQGRVLCQKSTREPENTFWFLPGGRAELGEPAEETLRREMQEELDEEAQVGRLLYFMENFFNESFENLDHHEIGLYFQLTFPPTSYLYQEAGPFIRPDEDGQTMIFEWLPIADLPAGLHLWPRFFCQALQALPEQTQHVTLSDQSY